MVHHQGHGEQGGELAEGDAQQGGRQAGVLLDALGPPAVLLHLLLQLLPGGGLVAHQAHPHQQGQHPAGESPGGVGEEHEAQHARRQHPVHRRAEQEQQPQPGAQVGHQIKAQQDDGQGVAHDHHLIAHGDEHHVQGPVGGGDAVLGHIVNLGGLAAGGGGGDGADIKANEGVAQAVPVGRPVAQPAQDQVGAQGLAPHKHQHEPQAQYQPAGLKPAQDLEQPGDGLILEQHPAGEGHDGHNQPDADQRLFPAHATPTPFSSRRPARIRARLSLSSCPFICRMLARMDSRAASS